MKNSFKISILCFLVFISSCKNVLDINPQQSIDASTAFSTPENIRAAITACYVPLKSTNLYGNRMVTLGEALSDNGRSTNKSGRLVNESRNTRGAHYSHWGTSYNALNRINNLILAIPTFAAAGVTDAIKNGWLSELKFLRALYYFDLVKSYGYIPGADVAGRNFGGVPNVLLPTKTGDEALLNKPGRAPQTEIYAQIYKDLDEAIVNLPLLASNPTRATKEGAQALYSRVALYNRDYQKCIDMSNLVIATRGNTLSTAATYVTGWSGIIHPESLFEVAFTIQSESVGVNESLQTAFTTLVARGNRATQAGFGDLVPNNVLLTALGITSTNNGTANNAAITARSADVRNLLFELGNTTRGLPFIECTKFISKNGFPYLDNVPVIRVAEMYLNRAESFARLATPNNISALIDVNTIRTNRGLGLSTAIAGQALIDEILLQRRLEFAFEGLRFFDLKRLGFEIFKPASSTTVTFDDVVILPGIPIGDVDGNPNLKQNFGY
jgi:hypothetical protein